MFKQISLLRRRPDVSTHEFETYYESHHAPLLAELMPQARRYVRRYVRPERNPFESQALTVPFDCMTEFWCDSREEFAACANSLADPKAYERLYEDEVNLFESHDNPLFSVEEVDSDLGGTVSADQQDILKLVFLMRRRPDLSPAEFRDYYETRHRVLGEKVLGNALRYVRRYVQPEINPVIGKPIDIPFDAMVEVWWKSRADWDATKQLMADSGIGREIYEDEKALFATHDNPVFCVEEADSSMRSWSRDGH